MQTGVSNTVRQTLRRVLAGSDQAAAEFRACFYREQVLREHWDRLRRRPRTMRLIIVNDRSFFEPDGDHKARGAVDPGGLASWPTAASPRSRAGPGRPPVRPGG